MNRELTKQETLINNGKTKNKRDHSDKRNNEDRDHITSNNKIIGM